MEQCFWIYLCPKAVVKRAAPHVFFPQSLFEVVTSEASYLRSLTLLIEHFMESRDLAATILLREHRILFSNIRKVKEVSERSAPPLPLPL